MQFESPQLLFPILAFGCAFLITLVSIPSIIQVARLKHLFDEPDDYRKLHKRVVPTLGGLAIFAGSIISVLLFTDGSEFVSRQYVVAAAMILFFLGIKDDIIILSPYSKFLGQFVSAMIIVWAGDIRITTMGGLFGVHELSYELSIGFSILTIMVIVNSFNLIDGIDCLAGTIGFIVTSAYAAWFYKAGFIQPLILSMAIMGSILAFLRYNITPARIFMGDTGSLLIGTIIAVLTLQFINMNHLAAESHRLQSAPVLAFGIMIIPLFDLMRVFALRLSKGQSPFMADKLHIHHQLLRLGLTHLETTFILGLINVIFIVFIFSFQSIAISYLMSIILVVAILLSVLVSYLVKRKNNE